jgi:hypothetical protein
MSLATYPGTCVRKAWLVLPSGQSIQLENAAAGYFCTSLDLGAPIVRDVTTPRPDQHGLDDRSMFFGGRTVTADITALRGAGASIDGVAAAFAPFMMPDVRPVLHYVLERPGNPERVLTVRGESVDWPIVGPSERNIVLTFIAADPILRDPTVQMATSWSGSTASGRVYSWTPPRIYPTGGSSVNATIITHGDLPAHPVLSIYGPITTPKVTFHTLVNNTLFQVWGVAGFAIAPGHYCQIDTTARTALMDGDPSQNVLGSIDWLNTIWPVIPPSPDGATMTLAGDPAGGVMTGVTQVQATWQDAFLS